MEPQGPPRLLCPPAAWSPAQPVAGTLMSLLPTLLWWLSHGAGHRVPAGQLRAVGVYLCISGRPQHRQQLLPAVFALPGAAGPLPVSSCPGLPQATD